MKELQQKIQEIKKDNAITCKQALTLANQRGISPAKVGDICNELGIKINNCQLGCF